MTNLLNALSSLASEIEKPRGNWDEIINKAYIQNNWFTPLNTQFMLRSIAEKYLQMPHLESLCNKYRTTKETKKIALIMAGNVPMAGFHDLICVLLSGNKAMIKYSSNDNVLIPFFLDCLHSIMPKIEQQIMVVDKIVAPDAVIATGSNNSARYFEFYFDKYPHIIRKNRSSIAILNGHETDDELFRLADDFFLYFGLGCRNVSTVFVPQDYDINRLFTVSKNYDYYINHNKYKNNLDYNTAILLLEQIPFLTNNMFILREQNTIYSPVSVINYIRYSDINQVDDYLFINSANIQCIVSNLDFEGFNSIPFGQSQKPELTDFADNIDTMRFLSQLD